MKRSRLLFVIAGAVVVLLVGALVLAFNSGFQTWIVRRAIAERPELNLTVGSVAAGLNRVELKDVRFKQDGALLTLPSVEIELPLIVAAREKKVQVDRLVASGWTLDLSNAAKQSAPAPPPPGASDVINRAPAPGGTSASAAPIARAKQVFAGIFSQLRVPVDLSLNGVRLEGTVILPESRGRVNVTLNGGGLSAGRDGTFNVTADSALTDEGVKSVTVRGTVVALMDTPRSFTRLRGKFDGTARGTRFPDGVTLQADVTAARTDLGETYAASVVKGGQNVITINAALPRNGQAYEGTWQIDVRDADVAPFAFGKPLPEFTAMGAGKFDGDAGFDTIHLAGRLNTALARIETLQPELAGVGSLNVTADFDLAQHGGNLAVEKFEAAINGAEPVAALRALQAFQFNPGTGELRTAETTRELVGLVLHGVPVAWVAPFVKGVTIEGGHFRGELSALPRGGGVTVRSTSPLLVDRISVAQLGKPLVQRVDLALSASADYTPKGWQAELSDVQAKSGESTLLSLNAKMGQLAGSNQPLKATGSLAAHLPSLLAQPGLAGNLVLTGGDAALDFVVSLDGKKELQASLALKNLATVVDAKAVNLPAISTNVRADISTEGRIAFNAPLLLEHSERKSDLTIIGTIGPEKDRLRAIDAEVTSTQLSIDDALAFAAVLPNKSEKPAAMAKEPDVAATGATPVPRDAAPPWAGVHGSLALQLKSIIYSDAVQVSNVTGRLRIDAGTLKLESLQAGMGETGRANVNGMVTFNGDVPQPYALAAEVAVREFDPGPIFRAMTNNRPPTVEGRFDVTSKVAGRAATFGDVASGAAGDFLLTSKGGVFRGLPVDVGNIVENTSKIAALIAAAGTAITSIAGKKDSGEVANKAEAVAELARGLNPIPFDQLSVSITRDAALNTTLRNFTLISPELRLTGNGTALHKPGSCLLKDSLAMDFTLRARGRQRELLKYLGAIEPQTDDLGYAACTVPFKVEGSLGKPDTTELNTKLAALAIEKGGIGDKAAELLNKIRGGGKDK